MICKVALIFAVVVALLINSNVDAQATVLTSPGSGSTSSVQGFPISWAMFQNASTWGLLAPYAYTNIDIANSEGNLTLVHTNGQSAKAFEWNVVWNFTAEESALIRTFMTGTSYRNNCDVRFTATWNSAGRFAIDTATWAFASQSLMPYGLAPTCNLTTQVMNNRMTLGLLPAPCRTVLIPGQKQLAQATPECLLYHARTALEVKVACDTVRAFLETVYCTDGSAGVDEVCAYNQNFLPSGIPGPTILHVGPDGMPGPDTQAPSSAGAVSAMIMTVFAAIVAALMF